MRLIENSPELAAASGQRREIPYRLVSTRTQYQCRRIGQWKWRLLENFSGALLSEGEAQSSVEARQAAREARRKIKQEYGGTVPQGVAA